MTMIKQSNKFLLLTDYGNVSHIINDVDLSNHQERHFFKIDTLDSSPTLFSIKSLNKQFQGEDPHGIVIQLSSGLPCRVELLTAQKILAEKKPLWFYWPHEKALEYIDQEKLRSYWRHWVFIKSLELQQKASSWVKGFFFHTKPEAFKIKFHQYAVSGLKISEQTVRKVLKEDSRLFKVAQTIKRILLDRVHSNMPINMFCLKTYADKLQTFIDLPKADALPLTIIEQDGKTKAMGVGLYLRLDFWTDIKAGGSYGHTCYVAEQLHQKSDGLTVLMPNYYSLLDELNVPQILLDKIGEGHEKNLILATDYYYDRLKTALQIIKPQFIYERLCLGNYTGARLAQDFNIPYIVEYNGSEIAMMKSFGNGQQYQYADYYLAVEKAAFNQAKAISVVSQVIADELIQRGVEPEKILVNPNGVEPHRYAPVSAEKKAQLKALYGWNDSHTVIGFIGTFGGWHGIDVLAESLHPICEALPQSRFLLIGDGNYRHSIDKAIERYQLHDKVILTGIVPQQDALELLQSCDIYISPHSAHMKDSQFFGSPTKIFEYMALEGGIVASDLMQIGEVLRPALFASQLGEPINLTDERAILCVPGDCQQLIDAIIFLAKNPSVTRQLGTNARKAAIKHFTWEEHIEGLWRFIKDKKLGLFFQDLQSVPLVKESVESTEKKGLPYLAPTDFYKSQAQEQWNNDPCGSHYVKNSQPHTLEWFLEAERYRYTDYAPWMCDLMGFNRFSGKNILEVGAGLGTDLAQFAKYGAVVSDLDLSIGHLTLAKENFELRALKGNFYHGDAESMPFPDEHFDMVYSNGVIHHSPNTRQIVKEMWRVLKPGGQIKIMVYAENSLHYWRNLVKNEWWQRHQLNNVSEQSVSIGDVMSQTVELSNSDARPLVKVYTKARLRALFADFTDIQIVQRQMTSAEVPASLRFLPVSLLGKLAGWNLILTAKKPG